MEYSQEIIHISEFNAAGLNDMALSRLVRQERIGNLGFGYYSSRPRILHFENDGTMSKINSLLDDFPVAPNRMLFSATSLNFCINQLLSSTTYLLEVEKEYLQIVFEVVKGRVDNVVLLKPSKEDKINYWRPNAIYVSELFKRSPLNKDGSITIEKLICDLLFDEDVYGLYSGRDVEQAISFLCENYTVNYRTLFAYASRKNRKGELLKRIHPFIPDVILGVLRHD